MMSDLVKRLRSLAAFNGRAESLYAIGDDAADHIEALEAQLTKADALADNCHEVSMEAYGYDYFYETTFHRDVHEKLDHALTEYRTARKGKGET